MTGRSNGEGRRLARRLSTVAALVILVLVVGSPALGFAGPASALGGQSAPAAADSIELTSQTPWVGGGGTANPDLRLGLKIAAGNPSNTTLQVSVYRRLVNRSDFADSLDGKIHTALTHAFDQVALSKLQTDGSGSYLVDVPVNPLVETPGLGLLSVQVPGVYPVQVVTLDRSNHILARMTTHLLFTGAAPFRQTPLAVALVGPVHAPPTVAADGQPTHVTPAASSALAAEAAALAAHPGVPVTLTPTAETLEALSTGSDADKTTLATLGGVVQATTDHVLAAPYVAVNVATMNALGLDSELTAQIARGNAVTAATLHVIPSPQTWAEPGALSGAGIDDLIGRGITQMVVDGSSLAPLPSGVSAVTVAQPFQLTGREGRRVAAVATDPGLEAHFNDGPSQILAAHQLLADLAMIQQEQPNATRGVVVTIPSSWPVNPAFLAALLDGLQGSPVVTPMTVGRLFSDVAPLQTQRSGPVVRTVADQQPPGPTITDAPAIRAARAALTGLASMAPTEPALTDDPQRLLLIAQSADLPDRQRPVELAAATKAISGARDLVHLPVGESITLTARRGSIPITLASTAPYTARVRIRLSSQKLAFHGIGVVGGSCQPGGTAETCVVDLHNQNTTLKVPVQARTAGVYPLKIDLTSPDGSLPLASAQYTVRSTAASGVGIVLSIGAALLLALWWGRDLHHGRRARQLVPAGAEGSDGGDGVVPPGDAVDDDYDLPWPTPPSSPVADTSAVGRRPSPPPPRPAPRSPVRPMALSGAITQPIPVISGDGQPPSPVLAAGAPAPPAAAEPVGSVSPDGATRTAGRPPGGAAGGVAAGGAAVAGGVAAGGAAAGGVAAGGAAAGGAAVAGGVAAGGAAVAGGVAAGGAAVAGASAPWVPADVGFGDPASSLADSPGLGLPPVPPPRRPPGSSSKAKQPDTPASFGRNTAVVAGGTLLSRLTGFGRVLALVWAFHVTRLGDVYNIANTVPNILYDLVLGGVLSATLIPVFVDYLGRDDEDEGWRAVSAVCTVIFASLLVLSAVFWLLVPAIIHFYLIFNHSAGAADERAIGTTLLRLFVPQLFLLGGIAVTTALLNARRRFAAAAFSPVVNNLICIAAIVATRLVATSLGLADFRHDRTALLILGLGTTAGYLAQLLVQLPSLVRGRFHLRPVWDLRHPAVRTVLRLSLWTFGAVFANQVAFNLVLVLAGKKSGDVVVFTTAYQFFQLPYAIFAVSIAAVVTPDLSDRWAKGDVAGFRREMSLGLRLTLAIVVPAAVGYVALAHPFLSLIFHHGSFSASDAHKIGTVVALFAVGLPGFSAYLLLMRAYQAMQDTRTMFWIYLVENGATIVLAAILYPMLGVGGLALGWVSAYSIGTVVAYLNLRRRTGGLEGTAMVRTLGRVVVATVVMFAAVWAVRLELGSRGTDTRLALVVGSGAIVGVVVYVAVCRFLGVTELDALLRRGRSRRGAHWAGRRA